MPRVPVYSDAQVAQAPLPAARQSTIAGDADTSAARQQIALGRGAQSFGADLTEIATKQQERENADQVFRAHAGLAHEYIAYQAEQSKRQGVDAKGLTIETAEWFDKKTKEHADNLANPVQQKAFKQRAAQLAHHGMSTFSHFEVKERQKAAVEAGNANIVGQIDLAASAVGGPMQDAAIAAAKKNIIGTLGDLRKLDGWDQDVYNAKEKEALTHMHANVIQNMNRQNPTAAKAYFTANKTEIDGTKYDGIEKLLEIGNAMFTGQEAADYIGTTDMTEPQALAYIREKYSGDEEKAAILETKTRFHEQREAGDQNQKEAADIAWHELQTTRNLRKLSPDVKSRLDGRTLLALEHEATRMAEGKDPVTDWEVYTKLRDQWRKNPAAFASFDIRPYYPNLSYSAREGLNDLKDRSNPDEMAEVVSMENQKSSAHDAMRWGSKDAEKKGRFDQAVDAEVSAEQRRTGKKVSPEERQKIIDRLLIKGEVESGSWIMPDRNKQAFELTPDEKKNFVPEISKADRAGIEAAFIKKKNRKPTEKEIIDTFKKGRGL